MISLFDPIRLGALKLPNRVFMAPLTRGRATRDHVPTEIMAEYYAQRAGAGLIISEATGISLAGLGWPYAPGLWNAEQVAAWQPVTRAVHSAGGHIFAQLWHMGRLVHPNLPGRQQPVSASATTAPGLGHTYDGKQPNAPARALRLDEIPGLLSDYRVAARNAIASGFDGVQVHAANGYLIDQFLRDSTNLRDDEYGGPIPNRIRLLREIAAAVAGEIGADRTAVRLSPNGASNGVNDSNPEALFSAAALALSELGIAFLELREPGPDSTFGTAERPAIAPLIRKAFSGPLVLNSDYDGAKAQAALDAGQADAIAFGRRFLANPDLPHRLRRGLPMNLDRSETWYTAGPEGYIDYPKAG